VPTSGQYAFNLDLAWIPVEIDPANPNGGELTIGGNKVARIDGKNGGVASGMLNLTAGDHPLMLAYFKTNTSRNNSISLSVEGQNVASTAFSSTPLRTFTPVGAITVKVGREPVMQRGFVNHQGRKKTHVILVGEPEQTNYSLDLSKGQFLQLWRGEFMEATPMWAGRGETQLSIPLGSVIEFSSKPSLTFLADKSSVWPDSNATYNYLGYDTNDAGRPIFKYTLGQASVREYFEPEDSGRKLAHTLTVISGQETKEIWCRLAEGSDITRLDNGLYAVNDKQYFIELSQKEKPVIRTTAQNTKELLLPVKAKNNIGTVKYAILW